MVSKTIGWGFESLLACQLSLPDPSFMTKVTKFIREVLDELRRATWPWDPRERGLKRYRELIDSTVVVFIATLLLAAWISLWDLILLSFMRALNWCSHNRFRRRLRPPARLFSWPFPHPAINGTSFTFFPARKARCAIT